MQNVDLYLSIYYCEVYLSYDLNKGTQTQHQQADKPKSVKSKSRMKLNAYSKSQGSKEWMQNNTGQIRMNEGNQKVIRKN